LAFDLESLGSISGAGLFGTVLGYLGIKSRLNKVEDSKQDKSICEERWKTIIDIKEDISYIRSRVDSIANKR